MNPTDIAKAVLAKASLYDQTFANPDRGILAAWSKVFKDQGISDAAAALEAVDVHYGRDTRRIMPADVRRNIAEAHRRLALQRQDDRVWAEIETARAAHDPDRSHAAYLEASRLLAEKLAAKHPEDAEATA